VLLITLPTHCLAPACTMSDIDCGRRS